MRWILLGCGILTGLFILGMGGCAGIFYFIYKGTDPIAQVGADYVKQSPEMRKALGPDITVNCVAPGLIATTVLERAGEAFTKSYVDRTVLKRLGRAEDIAAAIAYLASDDAAYVTGVILPVSGGIWPAL